MNIVFFNPFHNGDLFVSKEFVRQIITELPGVCVLFHHNNNVKVLQDLNIQFEHGTRLFGKRKSSLPAVFENDNTLYINTWLGSYKNLGMYNSPAGINLHSMKTVFSYVFDQINFRFNSNLTIKDLQNYIPEIDYSMFNVNNVDNFLKNRNNSKKILISNGPVFAKQSISDDFSEILNKISNKFLDVDFICTHPTKCVSKNIFYTKDIILDNSGCDLNEISYLSNFCSIIIGKNSGPYIFSIVKNNVSDTSKTFIQFNTTETDSLFYDSNLPVKYVWSNNFDPLEIYNTIEKSLL